MTVCCPGWIGILIYYYYYYYMCMSFVTGFSSWYFSWTSDDPPPPPAQASSFTLQYFPYCVWCSKYLLLLILILLLLYQDERFKRTSVSLQSWEFSSLVWRLLVEFEKYDPMELGQSNITQNKDPYYHATPTGYCPLSD